MLAIHVSSMLAVSVSSTLPAGSACTQHAESMYPTCRECMYPARRESIHHVESPCTQYMESIYPAACKESMYPPRGVFVPIMCKVIHPACRESTSFHCSQLDWWFICHIAAQPSFSCAWLSVHTLCSWPLLSDVVKWWLTWDPQQTLHGKLLSYPYTSVLLSTTEPFDRNVIAQILVINSFINIHV